MTENSLNNDRFPTDLHLLLAVAVCAALSLTLPTDRVQSFAELLGTALAVLLTRR
ncbi:hypothetical protein AB0G67_40420 [Streptomyces sp. NPDC021056]|uniref:hypothetical protein n=1 Tax=Streptomyces sp. NPDC021056 TaxID=3155012 RepID=UPI0033CEE171